MFTESEVTAAMQAISRVRLEHDAQSRTEDLARAALEAVSAARTITDPAALIAVEDHSMILSRDEILYMTDRGSVIPWYPSTPAERLPLSVVALPAHILKRGPK